MAAFCLLHLLSTDLKYKKERVKNSIWNYNLKSFFYKLIYNPLV